MTEDYEQKAVTVDLVETYNYLIGLEVSKFKTFQNKNDDNRKYVVIEGKREKRPVIVIWRNITKFNPEKDREFIQKNILKETHLQKVYVAIDNINLSLPSSCLINRDIKPSNVIKDNNGKVWIIDWENAILGDPLYDLAVFGVKYGHGILWENLVLGYGSDVSSLKYALYEIIALIGMINFYRKYQINYDGRQKQLHGLIQQLDQCEKL